MSEIRKEPILPRGHSAVRNAIMACLAALSLGSGCQCVNGSREIVINQPDIVFPPSKPEEIVVDSEREQTCRRMNEAETQWYKEMLRQNSNAPVQPSRE